MIVLIDNYDSFSYNLYQLIGSVEPDVKVVRNDAYTVEEIEAMKPEAIILSPGPGKPSDAGICIEAVRYFAGKVPIFGVCLGHQAICEAFGGTVSYAKELMHGKQKEIHPIGENQLFHGGAGDISGSAVSLTGSIKGRTESDCGVGRRRSDGGRTHKISDLWCTVSPGIGDDTGWQDYDRELYGCSQRRKRTMIKEAIIKVAKKKI